MGHRPQTRFERLFPRHHDGLRGRAVAASATANQAVQLLLPGTLVAPVRCPCCGLGLRGALRCSPCQAFACVRCGVWGVGGQGEHCPNCEIGSNG